MGGEFESAKDLEDFANKHNAIDKVKGIIQDEDILNFIRRKNKSMEGLVEGRIVHFVLDNKVFTEKVSGKEQTIEGLVCRPAIIVNAWGGKSKDGMINIQVFLDGTNDSKILEELKYRMHGTFMLFTDIKTDCPHTCWATSIKYSESKEIGTWHWPERS